ncbi:ABC-type multidrug transport system, ATPase component [Chitinophaga costaii]|uniref:ABC-type multidrug transport system, ATPase component n=1 Tax=Chitinophaga costaii TaxID=1335309 RepID=A0A1C4F3K8_9BACT|nr:ATP-binding cassette domain-containing protein [Chitinophaga costaii]PUZ22107.1 ABC transporter ATP-binding protein [Chitinophaga costaii]SCC50315.1 ABC-type multidrug transport system, ATPase component [Chitinophaga costaii]
MTISLNQAGKRYNYDWIFRRLSYTFQSGGRYAILGPNGSGKSTLLQVISGHQQQNEGSISYHLQTVPVSADTFYRYCSIAAPYLELIEEMTLWEALHFHLQFKPFIPGITPEKAIAAIGLEKARDKQIRHFSSGMRQRVKLALAIFSDNPVLLLDEPCTNLDISGIQLYQSLIVTYAMHKTLIVSSNDEQEYFMCDQHIAILDYK